MATSTTVLTSLPQKAQIAISGATRSVTGQPEPTKRDAKEIIALEQQYGINGIPAFPIAIERTLGSFMWDTDGRRYFDLLSAFSSANQGHCHPKIVEAVVSQCQKMMLPGRGVHNAKYSELCEKMCKLLNFDVAAAVNSGSEAIDLAIKIARKWGYAHKKIAADQAIVLTATLNYHGRAMVALSASQNPYIRENCGPFIPGIGAEVTGEPVIFGDIESLERAFKTHGNRIAAFMIETIQGNAGCIAPPQGYLTAVRRLCTQYNVLWVADEVQSGMGRTGYLCAYQAEDVQPDLVTLGKSLTGGAYAIGMVVGKREPMRCYKNGQHGSTFAGNPVASAAAIAAVNVVLEENLSQRALELGPRIEQRLRAIKSPHFRKIEGRGMLHCLFLNQDERVTGQKLASLLVQRGLITSSYGDKIRIAPPLNTAEEDLWWALDEVEKALVDLTNMSV